MYRPFLNSVFDSPMSSTVYVYHACISSENILCFLARCLFSCVFTLNFISEKTYHIHCICPFVHVFGCVFVCVVLRSCTFVRVRLSVFFLFFLFLNVHGMYTEFFLVFYFSKKKRNKQFIMIMISLFSTACRVVN